MAKRIGFDGNYLGMQQMKDKFIYTFAGFEGEIYKIISPMALKPLKRLSPVSVNVSKVDNVFSNYGDDTIICSDFDLQEVKGS